MFNKANEIVGMFINSNSVISRNENWNTSEYISVKKGSTICWSYETVGAGQLTINEFNDAKSFIKQTSANYRNNNGNELVVTLLNDTSYVRVGYRNNLTCDNLVLEYGNKRSGFREYKESQTYTIPTQQPMRAIGDTRDKFILKENGKWYERHYIGEIVLNGSESWKKDGVRYYISNLPNAKNINDRLMCYSNMFKYTNASDDYGMFTNGSRLYLYYSIASNTDEFKTMLSEKKPYVLYQLATPVDLPCTETQIQQLENKPSTYKDFTIIQSQDETEAYLEVSGIYDLNNLINN